jgi:hypothetical protein
MQWARRGEVEAGVVERVVVGVVSCTITRTRAHLLRIHLCIYSLRP